MKTDPIFYRLFQTFPSVFFELINHPPEEANAYNFSSVEVKQTAFRIDGVFLPKADASNLPIYFLEVQLQPDAKFYSRFFTEIFIYLDKTELNNDWRAVAIFPSRSVDTGETLRYRALLACNQFSRIYLDELGSGAEQSLGIETVKLVIEDEETAGERARKLVDKARQEIADAVVQQQLIQLIETIIVYKLPKKSRKEIAAMLGLGDLKHTRFYQEAFQDGELKAKLEVVPRLLALGLSVEQVATALGLSVEEVTQAAQQQQET